MRQISQTRCRAPRAEAPARCHGRGNRPGLTLIEMMIAMIIFVAVFGLAVPFFQTQMRSVSASAGRADALQNARFGQDAIDRELRIAGAGVVPAQPLIVQADPFAITFNVDLVSNDSLDMNAIYFDPAADGASTVAMPLSDARALPLSTTVYPAAEYLDQGAPSSAETISFWVEPDSAPSRAGQYVLYRSVNAGPKTVVSTGLLVNEDEPVFSYERLDGDGKLVPIPVADLPLFHTAPTHGSAADTGKYASVDSIRVVDVRLTGQFVDRDGRRITRTVSGSTRLLNAGMIRNSVCGETPLAPTSPGAAYEADSGMVWVSWNASGDQDAAEKDVARYVIYKREASSGSWGVPIGSVPASASSYVFPDSNLQPGSWVYGIAAQDCTPANSPLAATAAVFIAGP
jgi:prepilin-type N-terminal cleavage/methylation domain-containing protein